MKYLRIIISYLNNHRMVTYIFPTKEKADDFVKSNVSPSFYDKELGESVDKYPLTYTNEKLKERHYINGKLIKD